MRKDLSKNEQQFSNRQKSINFNSASLRPGFDSEPTKGINVRGMANALLKTEGTVTLKLLTMHEIIHTFHVMQEVSIANTTGF